MHYFNWSRSATHLHVVINVVLWLAAVRSWGVAHDIGILRYVADRKPFHIPCPQRTTLAGFGNACRREVIHDPVVVVICSQERSKQGEREQKKTAVGNFNRKTGVSSVEINKKGDFDF